MIYNEAYEKIMGSLDMIFSFSLKRTNDRYEAEDLSQEIVYALYNSAHSIRDINAFYGWMWGVASNVFKSYLRKKNKNASYELTESHHIPLAELPENRLIEKEELGLLYREISILSGLYRETMLLYYIKEMSCDEISQMLNISHDMVKQYLFKSRKKVREGMDLIRERGERSFNPKKFSIYFWGNGGNYCYELFKRKLPGNIMLEAYYEPITIEELSMELGVSSVYLEDEIEILEKNGLISQVKSNKYQSNIIIFTKEFETELYNKTKDMYTETASYLYNYLNEKEDKIRSIGFFGSSMSKNTLIWHMTTIVLAEASIHRFLDEVIKSYPSLSNGTEGYMWGLERKFGDNNFDLGIQGYTDKDGNEIRLIDYHIVGKIHYGICKKVAGNAILKIAQGQNNDFDTYEEEELPKLIQDGYVSAINGKLSLNLPVYTSEEYARLKEVLQEAIDKMNADCKSLVPVTEKILKNYMPSYLRTQLSVVASLKQVEGFIINTMDNMYHNKYIELPRPCNELLTAYVVLSK